MVASISRIPILQELGFEIRILHATKNATKKIMIIVRHWPRITESDLQPHIPFKNIHVNIIFPPAPKYLAWALSFMFPD
jgi:hypothetical protein